MRERIRKGLKVTIDFADCPVSMVGTILHVDVQTLVVSLASEENQGKSAGSLTTARDVRVSATVEDAIYRFTSTLLRSSGLLFYLTPPGEVQRHQRREHVRQPCLLDVEFVMSRGNGAQAPRKRATAVNISCGGLLLVCEGRMEVGDAVDVSVIFSRDEPPLQTAVQVVRTEQSVRSGRDLRRVALRVTDLKRADEKRLTQFITKLQTKRRLV
ncbi:PilZ domain-containing protein [Candidatus Methylomirabilis sp.]|uniref:flagellar brake protein n=1 Tax=Candidatus Methylomirabilis sp. TaxID=2032687 RepID=UPI002A5E15BF|nr:PilZ domain-containing protein [Candidatus Methylomirabilis sp.]